MTLGEALHIVLEEHHRSVQVHGTWQDYTPLRMINAIGEELIIEAARAETNGDIHGEHGMIRELAQVAACSIKAMMVLSDRPDANLAQAGRPEGAHSEVGGRVLPASLSLHQGERNPSNGPEGVQ